MDEQIRAKVMSDATDRMQAVYREAAMSIAGSDVAFDSGAKAFSFDIATIMMLVQLLATIIPILKNKCGGDGIDRELAGQWATDRGLMHRRLMSWMVRQEVGFESWRKCGGVQSGRVLMDWASNAPLMLDKLWGEA
jgi:hypothetical protein